MFASLLVTMLSKHFMRSRWWCHQLFFIRRFDVRFGLPVPICCHRTKWKYIFEIRWFLGCSLRQTFVNSVVKRMYITSAIKLSWSDIQVYASSHFLNPSDVDECASNPCQNGGICSHGFGTDSYNCDCDDGWEGVDCGTSKYYKLYDNLKDNFE